MKHKRLTALVLAAALVLAGCGGTKSSSGSAAASQSTGSSQNAPALAVQKERITEQFTLEKTVRDEYGITQKLTIHVPQLVCDSPDAEYINNELAAMYAEEYRDYESYPQAEVSQDEWCPQTYIDWDAYWYGDCVSLVVRSYYGGTDPIYSQLVLRFCRRAQAFGHRAAHAHGTGPGRDATCSVPRRHTDL